MCSKNLLPRSRATFSNPGAARVPCRDRRVQTRTRPLMEEEEDARKPAGRKRCTPPSPCCTPRSPPSAPGLSAQSVSAPSRGCQGWSRSCLTPPFLSPFPVFIFLHKTINISHITYFTTCLPSMLCFARWCECVKHRSHVVSGDGGEGERESQRESERERKENVNEGNKGHPNPLSSAWSKLLT